MPRYWQISLASAECALPEKTFSSPSACSTAFTVSLGADRLLPCVLVGAGGFEPPVLDPKSSVLPLDDAPTFRALSGSGRGFLVREIARPFRRSPVRPTHLSGCIQHVARALSPGEH